MENLRKAFVMLGAAIMMSTAAADPADAGTRKKVKMSLSSPTRTWKCKVKGDMARFKAWAVETCESLSPAEEPHIASVRCDAPSDEVSTALQTALSQRADLLACFSERMTASPATLRAKVLIVARYTDGERQMPAVGYDETPSSAASAACFEDALNTRPAGHGIVVDGGLDCSVYFAQHR